MKKRNKWLIVGLLGALLISMTGCQGASEQQKVPQEQITTDKQEIPSAQIEDMFEGYTDDMFEGYTQIEVDGGNRSGHREPNVVVDIGFGDREYWAFTNEHGQLVRVVAEEIVLQDDENEPVLSTGRYYSDEAKVPGVESKTLDEGHVIADSLGGVSNAYNITPQESTLNRHGDQAYMEKAIRGAGGATDFEAIITYPDTKTQIPDYYYYTYTIKGNRVVDAFPNVNPDEVNAKLDKEQAAGDKVPENNHGANTQVPSGDGTVVIEALDKHAEFIVIKNTGNEAINLEGWSILSVTGAQRFTFGAYTLETGMTVKVGDTAKNKDVHLHWLEGQGVWNNSKSDPAELYDAKGVLVARFDD